MPEAAAAAAPAGGQQRQERGGFGMNALLVGGVLYFGMNYAVGQWTKSRQEGITTTDPSTGKQVTVAANTGAIPPFQMRPNELDPGAVRAPTPERVAPIWPQDSHVDIIITLSPSFSPTPISRTPPEYVVMKEEGFRMSDYNDKRHIDTTFTLPKAVQNNGTLWGHFYIGLPQSKLDPREPGFDPAKAYHFAWPLTQYLPKKKIAKTRNLLEKQDDEDAELEVEEPSGPIIAPHYHPNASFSFIPDMGVRGLEATTPAIKQFLRLESTGARDATGRNGWYYPVLFVNTFWQLTAHMTVLNDTVKELPLHIELKNLPAWQFQIMSSMEANAKETMRQAAFGNAVAGGGDGTEIEMIKNILLDSNPWLLGVTAIVSVAHMLLETLAFGSDIAHYRKKKDNVGISVRSILGNVFMSTIIFLYLLDNSQNTSWMILGTQAVGIFIELWKVTTVVDVRLRLTPPGSFFPYRITFEDKYKLSETEEKTKEYDEVAFRYMYIMGVPLLIAYGIYSLMYDSHKSWYSFVITTLVGSVYAYGFLMMVPSLYINYRLKSVAHMPSRAMMYKFLNTFIDDLFAFVIKMPVLHRIATLRDDVIFFVYLYQRWKYRVDYTRVNEFGQGGDDEPEDKVEAEGKVLAAEAIHDAEGKVKAKAKAKASGADTGAAKKRK